MTVKLGINGFGRIGRTIVRLAKLRGAFNIVAVNDLASPEALHYSFKYDSIHGIYPGDVELDGDTMTVDGDPFRIISEPDPSKLPWQDFDVVLMDLNYARDTTSGQEGLDLLRDLQRLDATLPVVVMTAWASVDVVTPLDFISIPSAV